MYLPSINIVKREDNIEYRASFYWIDRINTMGSETRTGTISVISWVELSRAQQVRILQDMSYTFGKSIMDISRFFRPSCRVWCYREGLFQSCDAIAITFRIGETEYLDKFFVMTKRKGIGKRFLMEWIHTLRGLQMAIYWRTDKVLATHFYGKHPTVWTIGSYGEYVYQGLVRRVLNTEDAMSWLRLPSAFSSASASASASDNRA